MFGAATAPVPWHAAPALILLAILSRWQPIFAIVGLVTAWNPEAGALFWVFAAVIAALTRTSLTLASAILGVSVMLALKQLVVQHVLPASAGEVLPLLASGAMSALAVASARGAVWPALLGAGGVTALRLGLALCSSGVERVHALAELRAVHLFADRLALTDDSAELRAIVAADADADAAALKLGWREALELGWRPTRADGAVVEVARALEQAGRGGEAVRLLRRYPREGAVDGLLALYERVQNLPVHWNGAVVGAELPGSFMAGRPVLDAPDFRDIEWTAVAPTQLFVDVSARDPNAEHPFTITLDSKPPVSVSTVGNSAIDLGAVPAGPHRITVRYVAPAEPIIPTASLEIALIRGVALPTSAPPRAPRHAGE